MSWPTHSFVLAHSWGWDEMLLFVVPVIVALGGIRWVERRAAANRMPDTTDDEAVPEPERRPPSPA